MIPSDLVTVRIDVEGMRHSIVHAFDAHSQELSAKVQEQVDLAIKHFDFNQAVAEVVDQELHHVIKSSVQSAFSGFAWDGALREELTKAVMERMANGRG